MDLLTPRTHQACGKKIKHNCVFKIAIAAAFATVAFVAFISLLVDRAYTATQYALLASMIAKTLSFDLGDFIHTLGDAHLYTNHVDQAKLQLTREPKKLPELVILNKRDDISSYQFDDFKLTNYDSHDHIKAPISV